MTLLYVVRAVRRGTVVLVDVPSLPGVRAIARSLTGVEDAARAAIAAYLMVGPDEFDLEVLVDTWGPAAGGDVQPRRRVRLRRRSTWRFGAAPSAREDASRSRDRARARQARRGAR